MRSKLFLIFSLSASLALAEGETSGTFMIVKGEIKVEKAKGETILAKTGSKVFAGDTITSGPDSRAKIVMSDKNVISILPDSKMTIVKYEAQANNRNVELSLERGKIRATVEQKYDGDKNKFNVKTPTAVAGVRGTDFLTSFNTELQKSNVITFSGVVAVGQPGLSGEILNPVFVKPGMQTNVGSGKPAEPPRPVPKEEIKTINTETAAVAAPEAREPSSLPTMIDGKDLDPGLVSRDLNTQPIGGGGGFVPPTQKNPVGPPPNQFVDGAIQNQRTKVNIIVNKQ